MERTSTNCREGTDISEMLLLSYEPEETEIFPQSSFTGVLTQIINISSLIATHKTYLIL